MSNCFIDHPCDTQELGKNTTPVLECKVYPVTTKDGKKATITEVPVLTCEALWRTYQQEAMDIIAPGGTLIKDPVARNQVISAAYAALWLEDDRFQWAGLGAFASKQVGCGLMSAYKLMENAGFAGVTSSGSSVTEQNMKQMLKGLQELLLPPATLSLALARKEWDSGFLENLQKSLLPTPPNIEEKLYAIPGGLAWVMYYMLGWGNMLLFLDIFPLHAFYKKRGIDELKKCLDSRKNLSSDPVVSKYWTAKAQATVKFGENRREIRDGFQAIADGDIVNSVKHLADHEQQNILQPLMYEDALFAFLIRSNQLTYNTIGNTGGLAEEIQLTLASECQVDDNRIIKFGSEKLANLADVPQRMKFVYQAATRFNELLGNAEFRPALEKSLREIKAGQSLLS